MTPEFEEATGPIEGMQYRRGRIGDADYLFALAAYRMALDHPTRVERLALLNVIPTVDQFERMTSGPSLGYWPWLLLAQKAPLPRELITAPLDQFLPFI